MAYYIENGKIYTGSPKEPQQESFSFGKLTKISKEDYVRGEKEEIFFDSKTTIFYKKKSNVKDWGEDYFIITEDEYEILSALNRSEKVFECDDEESKQYIFVIGIGDKFIACDYCMEDNGGNDYKIFNSLDDAKKQCLDFSAQYQI